MSKALSYHERRRTARNHAVQMLDWYESHSRLNRRKYKVLQGLAIILSGMTPVLIVWDWLPRVLEAIPSAVASINLAMIEIMGWRRDWSRFAATAEKIRAELISFDTVSVCVDGSQAQIEEQLASFVLRINGMASEETELWLKDVQSMSAGSLQR